MLGMKAWSDMRISCLFSSSDLRSSFVFGSCQQHRTRAMGKLHRRRWSNSNTTPTMTWSVKLSRSHPIDYRQRMSPLRLQHWRTKAKSKWRAKGVGKSSTVFDGRFSAGGQVRWAREDVSYWNIFFVFLKNVENKPIRNHYASRITKKNTKRSTAQRLGPVMSPHFPVFPITRLPKQTLHGERDRTSKSKTIRSARVTWLMPMINILSVSVRRRRSTKVKSNSSAMVNVSSWRIVNGNRCVNTITSVTVWPNTNSCVLNTSKSLNRSSEIRMLIEQHTRHSKRLSVVHTARSIRWE